MVEVINDVYQRKAQIYGQLPWVNDIQLFTSIIDFIDCFDIQLVIDLGCGPAMFGQFLIEHRPHLQYIGVDRSDSMLSKAKTFKCSSNVRLLKDNIINKSFRFTAIRSLVLIKNVLHLIPDYLEFLKLLPSRFPKTKNLVIIETVSPDPECLEWVQGLFLQLGRSHKENWFECDSFKESFKNCGFKLKNVQLHEQIIDIDSWLDSFGVIDSHRSLIESYFDDMPFEIQNKMKYRNKNGTRSMLRLQMVLRFQIV